MRLMGLSRTTMDFPEGSRYGVYTVCLMPSTRSRLDSPEWVTYYVYTTYSLITAGWLLEDNLISWCVWRLTLDSYCISMLHLLHPSVRCHIVTWYIPHTYHKHSSCILESNHHEHTGHTHTRARAPLSQNIWVLQSWYRRRG